MGLVRTLSFISAHPLNRHDRMNAIRRFITWQIASRIVSGPVVVRFVNDARLVVGAGMTGATQNVYTGLHEYKDMGFLLHFLRSSDLFVDVGANVGAYSVLAGASIGARCVSVEPISSTYEKLIDNIQINRLGDRCKTLNIAVGKEAGELIFTADQDTRNRVALEGDKTAVTVRVPIRSLDDILGGEVPALIKIDVEGWEINVVQGAEATLASESLHAVIVELNGSGRAYGFDDAAVHSAICAHGFQPFRYDPDSRTLSDLPGMDNCSDNTLYIRISSLSAVQRRLHEAPPFRINGRSV